MSVPSTWVRWYWSVTRERGATLEGPSPWLSPLTASHMSQALKIAWASRSPVGQAVYLHHLSNWANGMSYWAFWIAIMQSDVAMLNKI